MDTTTRISDLRCATPEAAWSDLDDNLNKAPSPAAAGGWRAIQYRAGDIEGHCLQTSRPGSEILEIATGYRGWHAIFLGMAGHYDQAVLEVRLGDGPWQTVRAGSGAVQNLPWLIADLQGQPIQIRYPQDLTQLPGRLRGQPLSARLFWVQFQALSAEQTKAARSKDSKPLVYMNDGHSLFYWDTVEDEKPTPSIVERSINRFANSEWQTLCFCNGGADLVNYPSQVGTLFGQGGWDLPRRADHKVHRLMQGLIDAGHDALQLAMQSASAQDHQTWFYIRPQAWVGEPPFDHAFRSRFFTNNPQWRCRARDGRELGKMSIAYPQVRAHLNAILAEGLERGAKGLAIALVRALPLAWYEAPILEAQGLDRNTPPDDPRLLSAWGELFEQWLIEIRALMPQGQPLILIGGGTQQWHRQFGIDLQDLAQKERFDVFLAYPTSDQYEGGIDVQGLAECFSGNSVVFYPGLGDWRDQDLPLAQLRRRAHQFYQQGADGLCRWDTSGLMIGPRLDLPQLQALWVEELMTEDDRPLNEFAGLNLDEWPALDGF